MKKTLIFVGLLSFVFLWLGNVTMSAYNSSNCDDNCSENEECIEIGYWQSALYDCQFIPQPSAWWNSPAPTTTNTTTIESDEVPCEETSQSSLRWDPNAVVVIPGISCECKETFGSYYDSVEWRTKCWLCTDDKVCCGVKLNTKIPFIGDCIESSTQATGSVITETTAFPILVSAMVKLLISVILIVAFILIIVAGIMIATNNPKWGKDMIVKVAIWLAILGASGVILRLINPNFFG